MSRIAILYCKRIKDKACIACAKCHKAMALKEGNFSDLDEVELVAMTDCGDCPGLTVPKVKLLNEVTKNLERPIERLYMGTYMKLAMDTADCPIDYETLKLTLENKFGIDVVLGTHNY